MTVVNTKSKSFSGNDIREMFLRFFEGKGHKRVRSSSLVPHGDPTLLFTNAGMNQFKDVFLGLEKRDYNKATTAQKCVRAGGKHNDLENVGFTKRHHTFFEMLGNFSFGDYFKKEAIAYAWELVTSPEWFGISKEKLYVTIFDGSFPGQTPAPDMDRDDVARACWLDQGVPVDRIFESGAADNFWAMGDTGPCGPCSEIFYDMGPTASDEGHADCKFPCDCGRYVEIWNLVFMQYDRKAGVKDGVPWFEFSLLPKPCVDTGMGLERVAAVLQEKISNFETDLFVPLIEKAAALTGTAVPHLYEGIELSEERFNFLLSGKAVGVEGLGADKGPSLNLSHDPSGEIASLQVIADHSRAATFLIADGVLPSNEGRGYVLRKIIRRAIQHGRLLGQESPFLFSMVDTVCEIFSKGNPLPYPEILESRKNVQRIVQSEEERFERTLRQALKKLDDDVLLTASEAFESHRDDFLAGAPYSENAGEAERLLKDSSEKIGDRVRYVVALVKASSKSEVLFPGERAFRLYDTYGLPLDFLRDSLRDVGMKLDESSLESQIQEQKKRARASWKGGAKEAAKPVYLQIAKSFKTEPDFYFGTRAKDCRIEAIVKAGTSVSQIEAREEAEIILDRTVIYAESGGQVADTGAFYDNSGSQELAEVKGAFYPVAGLVAHKVVAKETLRVGDRIAVVADAERRARIIRNHTGTHLVNAALRNILGTHVKQSGSLNAPERLRFDFSHFAHVDAEELRDIEQQVNDEIRLNSQIETNVTSLEDALASGALAFFGDKYPESNVRVVTIPDPRSPRGFYSKELCGGTHVTRAGDIGVLKIVSEESVAAGVRRIEAVTGIGALEHYQQQSQALRQLAAQLNVGEDAVLAQVEKLSQTVKHLEKELEAQKRKGALGQLDDLATRVQVIKGIKVIVAEVQDVDREGLRQLVDSLRQKLGSGVVALGMPENGKVALIAGVTKDLTAKVHAGKLIGALAEKLGGKGGGRPDLAEAGGKDTAGLKTALQTVPSYIEGLL